MIHAIPVHITPSHKKTWMAGIYIFILAIICFVASLQMPVLIIFAIVLIIVAIIVVAVQLQRKGIEVTAEGVKLYGLNGKVTFAPFSQIHKVTLVQRYWSGIGQAQPIPHTAVMFSDVKGAQLFYVWTGHYAKADLEKLFNSFDPADRAELKEADMLTIFDTPK